MSSSSPSIPAIVLSNGVSIPSVAFGAAFGDFSGEGFKGMIPERADSAIPLALDAGFRHFDLAHFYRTERAFGNAIAPLFRDGKLKRENLFITSKLAHPVLPAPNMYFSENRSWNPRDYPATDADIRKKVLHDFDITLDDLGVGYVDLLLMHWPGSFTETDEKFAEENRLRVWKVFEELYRKGVARAIGVSNFSQKHLQKLIEQATIAPMVNQIETHPYCHDIALINYCKEKKIAIEAYCPLASGSFDLLQDPLLIKISKEKNRSVGQIILRWHLQHGYIVLPKSTNATRAKENLNLFDFELTEKEMKEIDTLHPEGQPPKRVCPDPKNIL